MITLMLFLYTGLHARKKFQGCTTRSETTLACDSYYKVFPERVVGGAARSVENLYGAFIQREFSAH